MTLVRFAWPLLLALAGTAAHAISPGDKIENFSLTDDSGVRHELYALRDKKAIVIMTQSNGCPIVRLAVPALREIQSRLARQGVEFLLLNPTLQDNRDAVRQESTQFDFRLPVLLDRTQKVGESLSVDRTADVYVIDPKTWTLKYHGPIDDRLSYESQRPVRHRYLSDALDAVLAEKSVGLSEVASPGCIINFPHRKQRS